MSAPATRNAPAPTLAGAFVAKYRHVTDDQRRLKPPTSAIQTGLDLIGPFVFAISGALMATRRDFDVVGIAILAVITALGGGILRDLVVGDAPPPTFTQWEYLVAPLAAAAVTFVAHPELEQAASRTHFASVTP